VHLERLTRERSLDEARDDHPVLAALTRADGIEEADDDTVQPLLLVVGERQELVANERGDVRIVEPFLSEWVRARFGGP